MNKTHIHTEEQKLSWWGDGEWVKEPDLVEFQHEGFDCKVERKSFAENNLSVFGGHLCGYVKIPSDHPYYHKHYDDMTIDCHGGLTYGEFSDEHWIGFDCAHLGDITPSMKKLNETDEDMINLIKMFSKHPKLIKSPIFNQIYRNIEFCIDECKSIANQLIMLKDV